MKTAVIAVAIITATVASAEIVRWPMRIVETKYTVHRMTGLTSGEKSKERQINVVVDITKALRDGTASVEFVRKTKLTDETESETSRASIPFDQLPTLLESIGKVRRDLMRTASGEDSESPIFEAGDLKLKHMNQKRRQWVDVIFADGSEFALLAPHVQQLETVLRKIR